MPGLDVTCGMNGHAHQRGGNAKIWPPRLTNEKQPATIAQNAADDNRWFGIDMIQKWLEHKFIVSMGIEWLADLYPA